MSPRLGTGDRTLVDVGPAVGERTFRARQLFVDLMEEVAADACDDFRDLATEKIEVTCSTGGDLESLRSLVTGLGLPWTWPDGCPPSYSYGFFGWPSPTPTGTMDLPLDECIQVHRRSAAAWERCGFSLLVLLHRELDGWTERWHLLGSEWVAGHLLARAAKPRFLATRGELNASPKLDHRVFPSPGVLAPFPSQFEEAFAERPPFRHWIPTDEQWGVWKSDAEVRLRGRLRKADIRRAFQEYRKGVDQKANELGLLPIRDKSEARRDFTALIRHAVLGESYAQVLEAVGGFSHDETYVGKAVRRAAKMVDLRL